MTVKELTWINKWKDLLVAEGESFKIKPGKSEIYWLKIKHKSSRANV